MNCFRAVPEMMTQNGNFSPEVFSNELCHQKNYLSMKTFFSGIGTN
jgi:hypothetical protein